SDLERLFARERDIQASLEHPNIARLYDAGISPEGLPYLAMEFVHGRPLTVWCDAHRIGLRERLQLFLQVTDAVQYAHARKIVHRDLKPSNILVTESGHVRLLDFGIAKLLADEESDRRLVHVYARALTPDYASPELLRGEPVEAASDVYSLGAVLYELLAGNRPYRLATGLSAVQLVRAVADAPVEAPSKRVAPGAGAARATTQDRLVGRLRGALDAVVLKALAWCPSDRYRDIAALADDLQRYLSGEPVEALPDRLTAAELIAALSRNPKVRVRGLASRSRSESGNTPAVTAADSRGAGTPRASMDHKPTKTLRITVQLLSAATKTQLWAQDCDLEVDERLEVKEGIAGAIADAVEAALGILRSDDEGKNAKS
ncbi:MAG TPA: serine/threonine-protein kinase, partial [Burkholderiaceae bacterium]|nr:serine/threonine-protein kinase [Burkholderiaceae bacterium]